MITKPKNILKFKLLRFFCTTLGILMFRQTESINNICYIDPKIQIQQFAKDLKEVYSQNAVHPELKYSKDHISKVLSTSLDLMNESKSDLLSTPHFADFYLFSKTMILRDAFIDYKSIGKWLRFCNNITKDYELMSHLSFKTYENMEYLSLKDIAVSSIFVLQHPDVSL